MSGRDLTRRRFLAGAAVLAAGGAATLRASGASARSGLSLAPRAGARGALPRRQHAWVDYLPVDRYGNPVAPRYDRLLFFDVRGLPTPAGALLLETRLRALEQRFAWSANGLLFTVSWGPTYFTELLKLPSPIPTARALSSFESPGFDHYHACIHLACNSERRLASVEAALVQGRRLPGLADSLAVAPALIWRETRTGFTGAGLAAANQRVRGIPDGDPVPESAPLFMGFRSGLKRNQATEDDVTIPTGPFAQGTTMQVSYMQLQLDGWYGRRSTQQRVALMYSPQTTVADVAAITTDAASQPHEITQAIREYGVIGHAQATAQARRRNRPLIIRRDFDTVDGGHAGLHFVSVQRSINDFVVTRNAMNATGAHLLDKQITATSNNGINAFISVRRRANYLMPERAQRAFPLLSQSNGAPR